MKKEIALTSLSPLTQQFIALYRRKKNYPKAPTIDIAQSIEILLATTAAHRDTSFEGSTTFDRIIDLKEFKLGYDGEELLDILVYYLENYIKNRLVIVSKIIYTQERDG